MNHTIRLLEDDDYDLNDLGEPEYDFAEMRRRASAEGREYRGKFAGRLMRIALDVAAVFPNEDAVNQALRELIAARAAQTPPHENSSPKP
jgi:hypothetical protein